MITLRCHLPRKGGLIPTIAAAALISVTANTMQAAEGYDVEARAEAILAAGSGDFAPYYIASNNHGIMPQSKDALLRLSLKRDMKTDSRFSYGFGADILTGWESSVDYLRFSETAAAGAVPAGNYGFFNPEGHHPSRIWIQQLYGEIRYRGVFLTAGMKEHSPALLSPTLSSGDLVESGNARPIPEVRVGFNDFQDIPFTNGWVQIQGEISYGKMTDNGWIKDHYNYYDSHYNQGALYSYKRCYFRTRPSERFSATVGMQVGAFFGGESYWYDKGRIIRSAKYSRGVKQFFKMLLPTDGGLDYYSGSSLGSWDINLRYRLNNGATLKAYMQKPFEDGSGIGFLNGFDGLWGLQFTAPGKGIISGAVIEYLDFTNQSGPFHWDPDDNPGTTITSRAEGADDYYNNHEYNSYANYGMAIGSPFMVSPIYNTDGYLQFAANRIRGFHIGVEGMITDGLSYRILGGYRKAWGNGYIPMITPRHDTSLMVEASYTLPSMKALTLKAAFGLDHGTLLGNNTGAMVSVCLNDILHLGKR